jgi:hypothetical protein
MNTNGHLCLNLGDASRRAGSLAPFATYYVYYSAGAETV